MSKAIGLIAAASAAGLLVFAARTSEQFFAVGSDPNTAFVCTSGDVPVEVRSPTGVRAPSGLEQMFATCDAYAERPDQRLAPSVTQDTLNR